MRKILCFGGCHIDRIAHAGGPIVPGSSNPVVITRSFGGVARNVAVSLARLGAGCSLVSRVGADADGEAVTAHLEKLDVDTAAIGRSATQPTATYHGLLTPDGDLFVAFADMAIYDEIDADTIDAGLRSAGAGAAAGPAEAGSIWFVEGNLPPVALNHLVTHKPANVLVAADAVSVAKSQRIRPHLDGVDILFANCDEAEAMTGLARTHKDFAATACRQLRSMGAGAVVLTQGPGGVSVMQAGRLEHQAALPAGIRNATGAGDALIAGTLAGLGRDMDLFDSTRLGQACAASALESAASVPQALTMQAAMARARLPQG